MRVNIVINNRSNRGIKNGVMIETKGFFVLSSNVSLCRCLQWKAVWKKKKKKKKGGVVGRMGCWFFLLALFDHTFIMIMINITQYLDWLAR